MHRLIALIGIFFVCFSFASQSVADIPAIEFVEIPPGAFLMGADLLPEYITSERGIFIQDEFPVRRVEISRGFGLSKYEVTNAQFELYDPEHRKLRGKVEGISELDHEAVVFVTWYDAVGFCDWLSVQDDRYDYRLPTEAEWEYACRAGTRSPYNDGVDGDIYSHNPLGEWAEESGVITEWFVTRGNRNTNDIAHFHPSPVDLKGGRQGPNAWGLYDMHGGVEEWIRDWYGPYVASDGRDPVGYATGISRVVRGGSHNVHLQTLRSANRSSALPDDRHCLLGFRVVRVPMGESLPAPRLEQKLQPWAKHVNPTKYDWPPDREEPLFKGPVSLYDITDAYGSEGLQGQFEIPLYTHNHSPAITWAENGDLLLAWFSGESEKGQELTVLGLRGRRHGDGSLLWDKEVSEFFRAADRNMHGTQLWNSAQRIASGISEPFTLYHINGICTDGRWSKLAMSFRKSTDNGATWSEPRMMKPETDAFHLDSDRNQPQGNVIVTSDGNFLCFSDGSLPGYSGSSINISRDDGKTWSVCGAPGPVGIHAAGVELNNGELLAFSRDSSKTLETLPGNRSKDGGLTWDSFETDFPPVGNVQRVAFLRLDYSSINGSNAGKSGEVPLLLISFAVDGIEGIGADGKTGEIFGAFAALSLDGGRSWPVKRVLSGVARGEEAHSMGPWDETFTLDARHGQPKAYWAATQSPDGVVHLTDGRLYYAFNYAWLIDGFRQAP